MCTIVYILSHIIHVHILSHIIHVHDVLDVLDVDQNRHVNYPCIYTYVYIIVCKPVVCNRNDVSLALIVNLAWSEGNLNLTR